MPTHGAMGYPLKIGKHFRSCGKTTIFHGATPQRTMTIDLLDGARVGTEITGTGTRHA
jgi:hypothetical protein